MARSSVQNFFATELTSDVGSEALVFDVTTTGNLSAPAYIVIRPRDDANREVILCDVAFTDTRFETSDLSNRYLAGSAKSSGQTHPSGSEVWSVPLAQHLRDLWDDVEPRLRVIEHGATAATTRPSDADTVLWIGSVEPDNAVENDIWIDTDGYHYLVHDGSSFVDPIANATADLADKTLDETITGSWSFDTKLRAPDFGFNIKLSSDPLTDYPIGTSQAAVASGDGWPTSGILWTFKRDADRAFQLVAEQRTGGTAFYFRTIADINRNWTAWKQVAFV